MDKKIISIIILLFLFGACRQTGKEMPAATENDNPLAWVEDATMYEVNVRQYTPEGTFNAFAKHLPQLKNLGVEILWFMPIHPIGVKNRKGTLGSYYSIKDYKAINPEFGTLEDFKNLVSKAHEMGFKVLIDCVANHSAWDNVWIEPHKDWYTQDSTGNVVPPVADWSDVAVLNYDNPDMRAAMLDALKYWVSETDIDGYRCDYAGGVPTDFWEEARTSLDSIKPVFMLAEDQDHLDLLNKAFDCNYGWTFHHYMNEIYSGEKPVSVIQEYFAQIDTTYPKGKYPVQFTSNHDENSWNGTVYERLGDAVKTFAALTFTVPGMPLVYNGQEAGLNKRLEFFEKDLIDWNADPSMSGFYTTLIQLKKENKALWNGLAGAPIEFLNTSENEKIVAFKRKKDNNTVIAIFNLSDSEVTGNVQTGETGEFHDVFNNSETQISDSYNFELGKWNYQIFIRN